MKRRLDHHYLGTCRALSAMFGSDQDADMFICAVMEAFHKIYLHTKADTPFEIRKIKITINNFFEHEIDLEADEGETK